MTRSFNHIISFLAAVLLLSCSDEFVNEKITISGVASSAIIISPEWEPDTYQFQCEGTGNDNFVIENKPDWLVIENASGKFADGIATIHCKANSEPDYSQTGIYIDQMLVSSNGKKYAVPVYYITEGNPTAEVVRNFEIQYNNYNNYQNQLQISNRGDGVLFWEIISMPEWLTVNWDQFDVRSLMLGKDASSIVPFVLNVESAMKNDLNGSILLRTNDKNNPLIEISVKANLGTPLLSFYDDKIDFGSSETTRTYYFYNHGDGILVWNLEQLPEWLTVSSASGILFPYSSSTEVTFTCDRSKLNPGLNHATIYLKSNDAGKPSLAIDVHVRVPGVSENIRALEGNIIDATMDKSTNTLYYITGQPNKLVAYDISSRTVKNEVELSKTPTCMAITEDYTKALIGHGGMMSVLNLNDFSVTKTYETVYTVYDAEWAKDDWYCFTKTDENSSVLCWINTDTDETFETTTSGRFGTADLMKVPGKPYIVGSRANVSPTGIFVFDIDTKSYKSYVHESIGNLWFFDGGEIAITGFSEVMRTSVITSGGDNPPAIGELKTEAYARPAWWIDFSPANHSIWAIFSYYTFSYYPPETATFYQFEDNDYTLVKKYTFDNMFQPDAVTTAYEVEARYLFANREGTEISLLRKGKDNNNWSIEFIPVQAD